MFRGTSNILIKSFVPYFFHSFSEPILYYSYVLNVIPMADNVLLNDHDWHDKKRAVDWIISHECQNVNLVLLNRIAALAVKNQIQLGTPAISSLLHDFQLSRCQIIEEL